MYTNIVAKSTLGKKLSKRRCFNILIVDDDKNASELFKQILEIRGHNITVINEGTTCISSCQNRAYDIIFMDYHIEDINGVDITELIKDVFHMNSIIFAYTGDTSTDALTKFKNIGMTGAIIKPVDVDVIDQLMLSLEQRDTPDTNVMDRLAKKYHHSLKVFK